ncbi:DinB family protein [Chitinophaga dinghuensis]|uniref:DinB family protein n=1 Tax=Chitinophaga dinghuensis TaxID=1539050 RepID=A0A327VNM2_9BACT|nr:DinB family protein [Chitinophaga dinghuensis]RAJ76693.1 DinB family protein [Chitinophaga dinghuensis]
MNIIEILQKEMEEEAVTTRKMLQRVPAEKLDWRPHEKSMPMGILATHIAELTGWVPMALNTSELDFAVNEYKPTIVTSNAELMEHFESNLNKGREGLAKAQESQLSERWVLRNGDVILSDSNKLEVIRMAYCQIVHHRAQLGVYLRLLDIPIPGSYGPSADEH